MVEKNMIWATMKAWRKDDHESETPRIHEVFKLSIFGGDYIRESSEEIKTIIAFYSRLYISEENEDLAMALGDFTTLKEAQDHLLEGKEKFFAGIEKQDYVNGTFEIGEEEDLVYADLSAMIGRYKGTDVFRLHENGDIEYMETRKVRKLL